jgi:hypothetical protein
VTTEEDDLRNRNDITFGAGSAVVDLSGAELTGTPADREISPAASAAADGTEDPQAPRPNDGSLRVDEDTPLTAVMRVAGGGPNRNSQRRLDRLVSAWEQGDREEAAESHVVEEPDPGVVLNPSRRNRTPLTAREVEAIQTARANGESVVSIAKRFNIHRMTVWEHTKTAGGSVVR